MSDEPLVVERVIDAPAAVIWHALTDYKSIPQWFFEFEKFEPKVGCNFEFKAGHENQKFVHLCQVTEVVPEKKLAYSWRYQGYEGDSLVTFELFPEGDKTRVKVTHAGLETFPKLPMFARENFNFGWTSLVGTMLKNLAEARYALSARDVAEREVVSSRVFEAPRERMFAAFSDPAQLAKWWGPKGFTNTITKFEFRPGGAWHLTMHGPDGTDYRNESEFVEIEKPRRIVYLHLRPMHRFQMSMEYAAEGTRTKLTWRMLFDTSEECQRVKEFVVPANEQNFDRLAVHLKAIS